MKSLVTNGFSSTVASVGTKFIFNFSNFSECSSHKLNDFILSGAVAVSNDSVKKKSIYKYTS